MITNIGQEEKILKTKIKITKIKIKFKKLTFCMKSLTFFVPDMCSKPIFCSKVAQKGHICQPRSQGSLLPPWERG